jgi:hypothetical protein
MYAGRGSTNSKAVGHAGKTGGFAFAPRTAAWRVWGYRTERVMRTRSDQGRIQLRLLTSYGELQQVGAVGFNAPRAGGIRAESPPQRGQIRTNLVIGLAGVFIYGRCHLRHPSIATAVHCRSQKFAFCYAIAPAVSRCSQCSAVPWPGKAGLVHAEPPPSDHRFLFHGGDIENSCFGSNRVLCGHGSGYCEESSVGLRLCWLLAGRTRV